MDKVAGFTIIELLIVIILIGILTTIGVAVPINVIPISQDNTRADDTASIARKLEDDYTSQVTGSPTYPYADQFVADSKTVTGTAAGSDPAMFQSPTSTSSSLVAATSSSSTQPLGSTSVTSSQYVYQPLTSNGSVCTSSVGQPCVSFRLFYVMSNNTQIVLRSLHQQ